MTYPSCRHDFDLPGVDVDVLTVIRTPAAGRQGDVTYPTFRSAVRTCHIGQPIPEPGDRAAFTHEEIARMLLTGAVFVTPAASYRLLMDAAGSRACTRPKVWELLPSPSPHPVLPLPHVVEVEDR